MKMVTEKKLARLLETRAEYQNLDGVRLSEPRLGMIHSRLQALLKVVQLESDGEPVEIDGFRLKDPALWTSPQPSVSSELWHISTACNMRCPFCYEEGDPQGCSTLNEPVEMASLQEIESRLAVRDRARGTGLFRPLTYTNEIFCNPQAMAIIERLRREEPDEVLTFVTNGTYLDEATVARLAALKPIFFNFSVNSLDETVRRKVLRDLNPQVAMEAIDLLQQYRIPYLGSLVCWPTIPWSDIENTVRRLDAAGCSIIRFSLSAYSKNLRGPKFAFDREEFWSQGLAVAKRLMAELETPIKVEPYHYMDRSFLPNLAGALKGSPAARAGLRAGDRLVAIDDLVVPSSNHALSALATSARRGPRTTVRFQPQGTEAERSVVLDDDAGPFGYPYDEMRGLPGFERGLILVDNLRFSYLKAMRETIDRHGARRVLLLSSEIMRPIVEQMLAATQAFQDIEIALEVPENRYFGGTIVLGDLLTVEDYVDFLLRYRTRAEIDLVLIPSSPFTLGGWRRDLAGVPFTDIERRVGLPTELILCEPLNG